MDVRRVRVGCEFVYVAAVDTPAVFQVEPLDAAPVSLARRGVVDQGPGKVAWVWLLWS